MQGKQEEASAFREKTRARLLLVRHAAPSMPAGAARLIGWTDVPLSNEGQLQARRVARRLASMIPERVYTSPLQRALQTAQAIAERRGSQLIVDEDLREIHCGSVDGMLADDVASRYPELWQRHLTQRDDCFRWPGGESYVEFRSRCLAALDRIAKAHAGALAVVVTHAGVISQALGKLLHVAPARWDRNRPDHASATAVEWCESRGVLVAFNSLEHLEQR